MWAPPQRLVHESLSAGAEAMPDKDAVVDEWGARTYAELHEGARRVARLLRDQGLERGDRVALFLDNTGDCATAIFGTLLAGGVFMVVNPQTKADKLRYVLDDSEAAFLFTEAHSVEVASAAARHASDLKRVFSTPGDGLPDEFEDLHEAMRASEPDVPTPTTIPPDLAALIYTSGTTGHPKGVMMSHEALVFTVGSIAEYLRIDSDDRILNILPFAFTYGLNQLLLTTRLGATLLLERSFAFPAKTLKRMREEEATVFPAVPTVFATILGITARPSFPSVRRITNAAAGLPPTFHEGLREVFPNALLFRMYGQTECKRVCYLEPELVESKPTSVGRAIPGTEAFVLDDRGDPVEPGQVGVLHVRGPHIMMGYWRAPDLTAKVLRDGPYPGERMLCTRDHFTVDGDGLLYFVDRSDDIIKSRGEKVSSVEVENALHTIPGISQAAVIGVPDDILGEAVRAYVVPGEGMELSEQEIIRACRERLENFMVPRDVVIVQELPQTDSGKVRKKSLVRD
jgi:long-chain acyl-CoA synthetase